MTPITPLETSTARRLQDLIADGTYAVGSALPAERELAAQLGVSRGVVRRGIELLASEGWLQVRPRCRPVVADRGPRLRALSSTEPWHVAVWLWPSASEYAASQILTGLQRGLAERPDLKLVIGGATGDNWDQMVASERRFLQELVDDPTLAGVVMWYVGGETNRDVLTEVLNGPAPVVFVDRTAPEGLTADHVGTDNEGSAEMVVRHLIDLGHRRIGCICNLDHASTVEERVSGWRRALNDAGIEIEPDWLQRGEGLSQDVSFRELAEHALRPLLTGPEPVSAIFTVNDSLALSVYDLLRSWNVAIPESLSLAGFDGLLRWMPGGGHLTTAVQDFRRIGEVAARLVIERTQERAPGAAKHVLLPAPLSLHGSTSMARQAVPFLLQEASS